MISVDYKDKRPIYEQLAVNITAMALSGELKPDEQLPSVRQLAVQLKINPNTIAKAYAELERRGVTYTVAGKGSFINSDLSSAAKAQQSAAENNFTEAVMQARLCGIEKSRLLEMIGEMYDTDK